MVCGGNYGDAEIDILETCGAVDARLCAECADRAGLGRGHGEGGER